MLHEDCDVKPTNHVKQGTCWFRGLFVSVYACTYCHNFPYTCIPIVSLYNFIQYALPKHKIWLYQLIMITELMTLQETGRWADQPAGGERRPRLPGLRDLRDKRDGPALRARPRRGDHRAQGHVLRRRPAVSSEEIMHFNSRDDSPQVRIKDPWFLDSWTTVDLYSKELVLYMILWQHRCPRS